MLRRYFCVCVLAAAVLLSGCEESDTAKEKVKMNISKKAFGKTEDGQVDLYTLVNDNGMKAEIMTYGGIIRSLEVPDRNGKLGDIVLGYDTVDEYVKATPYFGALIGRYGNRIAKGKFTLKGVEYTLATNNNENHLHGGIKGFDKVIWEAEPIQKENLVALKLKYLSKDGEEGYPGNLSCTVIYTLTNSNELKISYEAETDKATVINLTHHSYFNLGGYDSGDILGHELILNADKYTPVDEGLIPTGHVEPVKGTALDFRKPKTIGSRIGQVKGGYDHNFVIAKNSSSMGPAASVYEPKTGRVMEIFTTEPGIQFYSGNFLDGSNKGKGAVYNKHNGFCLETQHFPDSPNNPDFPTTVLEPGEIYRHLTVFKFSTR